MDRLSVWRKPMLDIACVYFTHMLCVVCYLFIIRNMAGVDESPVIEDVIETVEKVIENNVDSSVQLEKTERLLKFPLTRIKTIMKTDTDVTLASLDAVVLIAKATVRIR